MKKQGDGEHHLRLFGYCVLAEEALLKRFQAQGAAALANLAGEYVIAIDREGDNPECWIVNSSAGLLNYFYAVEKSTFHHGDTVAGILRQSGMAWRWNWRALADLLVRTHLVEQDTLHPHIFRLPPASILHWKNGALRIEKRTWNDLYGSDVATPEEALSAFNDEVLLWLTPSSVISLSAGLDSRVILSSMLRAGHKPRILTMGHARSTDVIVARAIGASLGAHVEVVGIDPEECLRFGPTIVELTNGTKTANHWHTYIYPKKAGMDFSGGLFVGAGGEFARTHYWDRGWLLQAADLVAPAFFLRRFWSHKMELPLPEEDLATFHPELAREFTTEACQDRVRRIIALCEGGILAGLDRFCHDQATRSFIANGVQLYFANAACRMPFFSREWMRRIWNLPRGHKLGSNWHRLALARNYPQLLEFPEQKIGPRTAAQSPWFYWHQSRQRVPVVNYTDYTAWCADGCLADFVMDRADILAEIINPATVRSVVQRRRQTSSHTRVIAYFLALIHWIDLVKSIGATRRDLAEAG